MRKLIKRFYLWYVHFWYTHRLRVIMVFLLFLLLLSYLWRNIFISVGSGHAAVLWSRFGQGTINHDFGEGLHLVWPWDEMVDYEIRVQQISDHVELLTVNGLVLSVNYSVRFYPIPGYLHLLHQKVGPDYIEKIVRPETISALRRVLGNYRPEEIYAKDEFGLKSEIEVSLRNELKISYIELHDVMITKLMLPTDIQDSIQDKLVQEQKALSYQYILEQENQEKKRRTIEAEGIEAFEKISKTSMLKWRGIEATETIAKSPNTKLVLIGPDSQSLPILLNADKP